MTDNTDNIELQNIQTPEVEQPSQPTVNDILENKVEYFSLPKDERDRLLQEYQTTIPEDSLTKKLGLHYAPPQMFGGKDRQGNSVKPKSFEEFEQDTINKVKYNNSNNSENFKAKEELAAIKKQMEEMSALVKVQTSNQLQSEEETLAYQIQQARDENDFDAYDKLIDKRSKLQQVKSKFEPIEPTKEIPSIQYTPKEQAAIQDFKYIHKDFIATTSNNSQIRNSFDDFTKIIARNKPELSPQEILESAKKSTEEMFPNFFTKSNNVFMNNQYSSAPANNTFQKKPEAPKLIFENLSPSDQKFIEGACRNYPGKTPQQVAETLFAKYQPKN